MSAEDLSMVRRMSDKLDKIIEVLPQTSPEKLVQINDEIAEKGYAKGFFDSTIRRWYKNNGYLVVQEKSHYYITKKYAAFYHKDGEMIMTKDFVLKNKVPNSVIKFYLAQGIRIDQHKKYKYGCNYPSDAYDICECDKCKSDKGTKIGYTIFISKINTQ